MCTSAQPSDTLISRAQCEYSCAIVVNPHPQFVPLVLSLFVSCCPYQDVLLRLHAGVQPPGDLQLDG